MACKKFKTIVLWPCGTNGNKNMPCFFVFMTIVLWPCSVKGNKTGGQGPSRLTYDNFVSSEAPTACKKFMTIVLRPCSANMCHTSL